MIKKILILLFINLVLVLLQLSFFGELFEKSFVPNLVLAFSFALAFSGHGNTAKMSAFLGGLLLDLLGFNIVGLSAVVLLGCMIMYDFVRKSISRNFLINAVIVVLSALFYDRIFSGGIQVSAFITLIFCGIFYFLTSNAKQSF